MMFGRADDRAWWQAGRMPLAMIVFWGLPIWASYSLITGAARQPGRWARDGEHRCGDARRVLNGRSAAGEIGTGAYRRLRDEVSSGDGRRPAGQRARPTTSVAADTVRACGR
ncbi:MAG TPA: hypothetical protein VEH31_16970 [Streptosporangiaceae bacterium]|nr:hypothetical protein [Streptosporangiaceae bacterium]